MHDWKHHLLKKPFNSIKGQDLAKRQLCSALIANRHVIIVGPPGIGKTTIAKNVADLLPELSVEQSGLPFKDSKKTTTTGRDRFIRVQGSPDLTVEDLFGDIDPIKALKFGPQSMEAFTPGKIFRAHNGILFFDELNRAPEKTQNAFLQVLEEGTVTIGSYTIDIPSEFIFIGTMNPHENAATEKLSAVLMDRFDVVHMSYPEEIDIEADIVKEKAEDLKIAFPEHLFHLTLKFIHELRANKNLVRKPSVRASMGLYERAQANAMLSGRKEVNQADINEALLSVLAHRIELKPSLKYSQTPEDFLKNLFSAFAQENPELASHGGEGL